MVAHIGILNPFFGDLFQVERVPVWDGCIIENVYYNILHMLRGWLFDACMCRCSITIKYSNRLLYLHDAISLRVEHYWVFYFCNILDVEGLFCSYFRITHKKNIIRFTYTHISGSMKYVYKYRLYSKISELNIFFGLGTVYNALDDYNCSNNFGKAHSIQWNGRCRLILESTMNISTRS